MTTTTEPDVDVSDLDAYRDDAEFRANCATIADLTGQPLDQVLDAEIAAIKAAAIPRRQALSGQVDDGGSVDPLVAKFREMITS